MQPQRLCLLTPEQEKVRCELTWKMWDSKLWLAAFGSEEELSTEVALPKQFKEQRSDTWLLFSDQIPFWVKIGHQRCLLAEEEVQGATTRRRLRRKVTPLEPPVGQMSQQVVEAIGDLPNEGQGQSRGRSTASQEKFRVTFEARQGVKDWFKVGERPTGVIFPSILVLPGVHARLSNIDAEGKWIQEEVFSVMGIEVKREPGGSARNVLKAYRVLRSRRPDLFEDVLVIKQPSATVD